MLLNETSKGGKTIEHIIEIAKSIKDQPLELEAWLRLILMYARANQTETVLSLWPKVSHLATHIDNHRLQLLKLYVEAQCAFSQNEFVKAKELVNLALNRPIPTLARNNFLDLNERLEQIEVV